MTTQAPRRSAIIVAILFALSCFGLTLFVWKELGGPVPFEPQGYRFNVLFTEASQLTPNADVRISGVSVGKVVKVRQLGERSEATIQMDPEYAPIPSDTHALLRQKTLLGERFVALSPGTRQAPKLADGGTLKFAQTVPTQPLDKVLNAFDPEARRNFKRLLDGAATALNDRGPELNAALGDADPAVTSVGRLMLILDHQSGDVRRLVRDTGTVLDTLGSRQRQLQTLVGAGNEVLGTTAQRDRALTRTVRALPRFLGELRATLRAVDATGAAAAPTLAALRPVAPLFRPALESLNRLGPRLIGLLHALGPVITVSRRALPAATRLLRAAPPLVRVLEPAAQEIAPLIDYISRYHREVTATFANVGASLQAQGPAAGGGMAHYLRTLVPITNESIVGYSKRLGTNRHNPYFSPGELDRIGRGGLRASDCRNTGNAVTVPVIGGGGPPPCVVQPPWKFNGPARFFQHVTKSSR